MDTNKEKVYLGGPMTGLQDHNFRAFRQAAESLNASGYEVLVSPAIYEDIAFVEAQPRAFHMRRDIELLLKADRVAMLDGWANSRGAMLEIDIARELGLSVLPVEDLL